MLIKTEQKWMRTSPSWCSVPRSNSVLIHKCICYFHIILSLQKEYLKLSAYIYSYSSPPPYRNLPQNCRAIEQTTSQLFLMPAKRDTLQCLLKAFASAPYVQTELSLFHFILSLGTGKSLIPSSLHLPFR